jgi:hypothetical protein
MYSSRRGIIVYIEYQSVCPFVEIGTPSPTLSPSSESVSPVWVQRGEEQHSLEGEGAGAALFGRL